MEKKDPIKVFIFMKRVRTDTAWDLSPLVKCSQHWQNVFEKGEASANLCYCVHLMVDSKMKILLLFLPVLHMGS